MLYKTVVKTLRNAKLIPQSENKANVKSGTKIGLIIVSAIVFIGSVLLLLILGGVI